MVSKKYCQLAQAWHVCAESSLQQKSMSNKQLALVVLVPKLSCAAIFFCVTCAHMNLYSGSGHPCTLLGYPQFNDCGFLEWPHEYGDDLISGVLIRGGSLYLLYLSVRPPNLIHPFPSDQMKGEYDGFPGDCVYPVGQADSNTSLSNGYTSPNR